MRSGVGSFLRILRPREEHAKISSENEAGSLSSLGSMKGCVRPGEISDTLLRWSLEIVFSSRPTPHGMNRAMVSSRREAGPLPWAEQDRSVKAGCVRV